MKIPSKYINSEMATDQEIVDAINIVIEGIRSSTAPLPTGTENKTGVSGAMAKSDHQHNTSIKNYLVRKNSNFSSNRSGVWLEPPETSITVDVIGSYKVIASATIGNSNNGKVLTLAIFKNGLRIEDSQVSTTVSGNRPSPVVTIFDVSIENTTDVLDLRVMSNGNTTTVTERTISLIRLG